MASIIVPDFVSDFISYCKSRIWSSLSFNAIKLRFLLECGLPLIGMKLQDFYDLKEKIYIHPECSSALKEILAQVKFNVYERIIMQQLMTNDYHDPDVVKEFGAMLDQKFIHCGDTTDVKRKLNKVFSIDGLGNDMNYANNIDYLKFPMREEPSIGQNPFDDLELTHVTAVRHLYNMGATPLQILAAILAIYRNDDGGNKLAQSYKNALIEIEKHHDEKDLGMLKDKIMEKIVKIKLEKEAASREE